MNASWAPEDPPRDWRETVPEPQPGDSWWDNLGKPWYEEPEPRFVPPSRPGETWHEQMLRKRSERQARGEPLPGPWTPPPQPIAKMSQLPREIRESIPRLSRKPGGKYRSGQRSGDRKIAVPDMPVDPFAVLTAFQRRWRGKYLVTLPWRMRGLAVIAVAMSAPKGTTIEALSRMLPQDVLRLSMPLPAWRWVVRWLKMRRSAFREGSDHQPWLTWVGSRGVPRQISWSATRTLDRAGLPGWRLSKLLGASWGYYVPTERFGKVAGRLLSWDSPLRALAARPLHPVPSMVVPPQARDAR